MKKLYLIAPLLLVIAALVWFVTAAKANTKEIVGTWNVDAIGAPYVPHMFMFNSDGTLLTTNPTSVQEDPRAPHGGSNDSIGMGMWKTVKLDGKEYVIGTFEQLNANADDHKPADTLAVTFKISVDGDGFNGPAIAKLGESAALATLEATRMKIDQAAAGDL